MMSQRSAFVLLGFTLVSGACADDAAVQVLTSGAPVSGATGGGGASGASGNAGAAGGQPSDSSPGGSTAAGASGAPAGRCGDANVDVGEACDGTVPPGATCPAGAFGAVSCTPACTLDTSGCVVASPCGDTRGVQAGAPWPLRGRCPTRSETGAASGPTSPTVAWSTSIGSQTSAAVIDANGTAYVMTDGASAVLMAIDSTGKVLWQSPIGAGGGQTSSAAIGADGTIYTATMDATLRAFAPDGTLRWAAPLHGSVHVSSPAIGGDGTVYVTASGTNADGSPNTSGVAWLEAITPGGTTRWSLALEDSLGSSPALDANGTSYLLTETHLYAILPTGTIAWKKPIVKGSIAPPVVRGDGTVYAAGDGSILAFTAAGDQLWSFPIGTFVSVALALGPDGTLYAGSDSGGGQRVVAIAEDGTQVATWLPSFGTGMGDLLVDASSNVWWVDTFANLAVIRPGEAPKSYGNLCADGAIKYASIAMASDGSLYVAGRERLCVLR